MIFNRKIEIIFLFINSNYNTYELRIYRFLVFAYYKKVDDGFSYLTEQLSL